MIRKFKIGDKVVWCSQSHGKSLVKEGIIAVAVPQDQCPERYVPDGFRMKPSSGMPRDHESYLVWVKFRGIYWPRVSALKGVKGV